MHTITSPTLHPGYFTGPSRYVSRLLGIFVRSPRSSRFTPHYMFTVSFPCPNVSGVHVHSHSSQFPSHASHGIFARSLTFFTFIHKHNVSRFTLHPGSLSLPVPHVPHVSMRSSRFTFHASPLIIATVGPSLSSRFTFLTFHVSHFNNSHTTKNVKT